MNLQRQNITIPLAQGLNTGIDKKIAPNGVLTSMENAEVTFSGLANKRRGFEPALIDLPAVTDIRSLISYDGINLYCNITTTLAKYSFRQNAFVRPFIFGGPFDAVDVEVFKVPIVTLSGALGSPPPISSIDIAATNLSIVAAINWRGEAYFSWLDKQNFRPIRVFEAVFSADESLRVRFNTGTTQVIVAGAANNGIALQPRIVLYQGNETDYEFTDIFVFDVANNAFDMDFIPSIDRLALAFSDNISGNAFLKLRPATSLDTDINDINVDLGRVVDPANAKIAVSEVFDNGVTKIVVAFNDSLTGRVYAAVINTAGAILGGPVDTSMSTGDKLSIDPRSVSSYEITSSQANETSINLSGFDTPSFNEERFRGVSVFSRGLPRVAVTVNTPYRMFRLTSDIQPTFIASNGSGPTTNVPIRNFVSRAGDNSIICDTVETSNQVFVTGQLEQSIGPGNSIVNTPYLVKYDFANSNPNFARQEDTQLVGGGILKEIDGDTLFTHNFTNFPNSITFNSFGVGIIDPGTYQYIATYEYTSTDGDIEESSPSLPLSVVVAAPSSVLIDIEQLIFIAERKRGLSSYVFYRTTANGQVFRRVGSLAALLDGTFTSTFTDNIPDSALISNALLYTTGGVVPNISPGSPSILTERRDRTYVVPADNLRQIWISKRKQPGRSVEFSESLIITYPGGEDITAIGFIDDRKIIFTPNTISYYVGEGPNDIGANNLSNPTIISTDIGNTKNSKILNTSIGVFFRSDKGIRLLANSLEIIPIGEKVKNYRGFLIRDAFFFPEEEQVRFVLNDDETVLVYDYSRDIWSELKNFPVRSAVRYQDSFAWINSQNLDINIPTSGFTDNTTFIPMRIKTAWFNMAGINGFARCRRASILGDFKSNHNLNINIFYDFDENVAQTVVIDTSQALSAGDNVYEFRFRLDRQKMTSIRFEIFDSNPTGSEESYAINAIVMEAMVKGDIDRLRASKTF